MNIYNANRGHIIENIAALLDAESCASLSETGKCFNRAIKNITARPCYFLQERFPSVPVPENIGPLHLKTLHHLERLIEQSNVDGLFDYVRELNQKGRETLAQYVLKTFKKSLIPIANYENIRKFYSKLNENNEHELIRKFIKKRPSEYSLIPQSLQEDRQIALICNEIPPNLIDDREVVLNALSKDPHLIAYLPAEWQSDSQVALLICENGYSRQFRDLSENIRGNFFFISKMLKNLPHDMDHIQTFYDIFSYIPINALIYHEEILKLVADNEKFIKEKYSTLPEELRVNPLILCKIQAILQNRNLDGIIRKKIFESIPTEARDRALYETMSIKNHNMDWKDIPPDLQDRQMALLYTNYRFEQLPEELRFDRKIADEALKNYFSLKISESTILEHLSPEYQKDKALVKSLIGVNHENLKYACPELQEDAELQQSAQEMSEKQERLLKALNATILEEAPSEEEVFSEEEMLSEKGLLLCFRNELSFNEKYSKIFS